MKNRRHKVIREIIEDKSIETQCQLTEELRQHGFNVTQATISRDIKEMGLIKVSSGANSFRYSFPPGLLAGNSFDRAKRMFRDNLLRVETGSGLVVLKTLPGTAQGVAFCIDGLNWNEIAGTLAGDDTVFLALRESYTTTALAEKIHALAQ
ncbi:MAG: arginine repressor [Clostridiales bacterium]